MAFKDLPDLTLIEECRKGNSKAFDTLFKRYFNKLYKYTCYHVKDTQLAEELVMDLMLWLWNKRESIEVKGSLSAYLFRAVKNAIYNHFRRNELITTSIELEPVETVADTLTDDQLSKKELDEQYKINLTRLTPQRQKVFRLSREEDMTYTEIAAHLNLSVKTVEAHMTASLQFMRNSLKDYSELITILIFIKLFI